MTVQGQSIASQKDLICVMTDIVRAKDEKEKALHEALKIQNNLDTNKMALKDLKEEKASISNELAKLETNSYFLNVEEKKKLTAEIDQIQKFCSAFEKALNPEENVLEEGQNENSSKKSEMKKSLPVKMQGCPIIVTLNEYVSTKTLKSIEYYFLLVFTLTIIILTLCSPKNIEHDQNSKMSLEEELSLIASLLEDPIADKDPHPIPSGPVSFTATIRTVTYDYSKLNEASMILEYDNFVHVRVRRGCPGEIGLRWGNWTSHDFKQNDFCCYYPGIYVFTWTAGNITSDCHENSTTRFTLQKNGETVASTLRTDNGDHAGAEKLALKSGDTVSLNIMGRCLSTGIRLTTGKVTFMGLKVG